MRESAKPKHLDDGLSSEERKFLLQLARQALEQGVRGETLPPLDLSVIPPRLINQCLQ